MSFVELIVLDRNNANFIDASSAFAIFDGHRFPGLSIETQARNKDGIVIAAIARYPDRTRIAYRWCPVHGPHFYIPEGP